MSETRERDCDTIMIGVCPTCRGIAQLISSECAPPAEGHPEIAGEGGSYWVRKLDTPSPEAPEVEGERVPWRAVREVVEAVVVEGRGEGAEPGVVAQWICSEIAKQCGCVYATTPQPEGALEEMVERLAMHLAGCDRETWREYAEEVRESYRAEARRILGLEKDDE